VDCKRQGGHGGDQDPAENGQEKAVFDVQILMPSKNPPKGQSHQDDDDRREGEGKQIILSVIDGTDYGQAHGAAGENEQLSQDIDDGGVVHRGLRQPSGEDLVIMICFFPILQKRKNLKA
jgi:hypothetical protein